MNLIEASRAKAKMDSYSATNAMKHEMLDRLEHTAKVAGLQVTALSALDYVGESSDYDLHDQLTTLHEVVLELRDAIKHSQELVPSFEQRPK